MQSTTMAELKIGWWGLFDPLYGPEKLLEVKLLEVHELPKAEPGLPVLHMHVCNERDSDRHIMRAAHEPVIATGPYPDSSAHVREASPAWSSA